MVELVAHHRRVVGLHGLFDALERSADLDGEVRQLQLRRLRVDGVLAVALGDLFRPSGTDGHADRPVLVAAAVPDVNAPRAVTGTDHPAPGELQLDLGEGIGVALRQRRKGLTRAPSRPLAVEPPLDVLDLLGVLVRRAPRVQRRQARKQVLWVVAGGRGLVGVDLGKVLQQRLAHGDALGECLHQALRPKMRRSQLLVEPDTALVMMASSSVDPAPTGTPSGA